MTTFSGTDLRVVLAYGSISAACRATECFKSKRSTRGDERAMSVSPWSFAMLESPRLFAQAAANVGRAHVLAIATCEAKRPMPGVAERWLKACLAQRHKAHLTVAAIFEGDDLPPNAETAWIESLERVVVGAGCAFLAWPGTQNGPSFSPKVGPASTRPIPPAAGLGPLEAECRLWAEEAIIPEPYLRNN
jgi:hypothetical protein